ncbi:hypothetical protein ARMGADRAFT_1008686 [Armillaria gallica]|uniref:Uncharacterized protein n=1 Tax=Armillaria gallica TaxID=47427 RepID=A0A2H3DSN8_ARMGA|nr:hypothetical protein ARMGADRAFT_1008686 [Armillaria gallica]
MKNNPEFGAGMALVGEELEEGISLGSEVDRIQEDVEKLKVLGRSSSRDGFQYNTDDRLIPQTGLSQAGIACSETRHWGGGDFGHTAPFNFYPPASSSCPLYRAKSDVDT